MHISIPTRSKPISCAVLIRNLANQSEIKRSIDDAILGHIYTANLSIKPGPTLLAETARSREPLLDHAEVVAH